MITERNWIPNNFMDYNATVNFPFKKRLIVGDRELVYNSERASATFIKILSINYNDRRYRTCIDNGKSFKDLESIRKSLIPYFSNTDTKENDCNGYFGSGMKLAAMLFVNDPANYEIIVLAKGADDVFFGCVSTLVDREIKAVPLSQIEIESIKKCIKYKDFNTVVMCRCDIAIESVGDPLSFFCNISSDLTYVSSSGNAAGVMLKKHFKEGYCLAEEDFTMDFKGDYKNRHKVQYDYQVTSRIKISICPGVVENDIKRGAVRLINKDGSAPHLDRPYYRTFITFSAFGKTNSRFSDPLYFGTDNSTYDFARPFGVGYRTNAHLKIDLIESKISQLIKDKWNIDNWENYSLKPFIIIEVDIRKISIVRTSDGESKKLCELNEFHPYNIDTLNISPCFISDSSKLIESIIETLPDKMAMHFRDDERFSKVLEIWKHLFPYKEEFLQIKVKSKRNRSDSIRVYDISTKDEIKFFELGKPYVANLYLNDKLITGKELKSINNEKVIISNLDGKNTYSIYIPNLYQEVDGAEISLDKYLELPLWEVGPEKYIRLFYDKEDRKLYPNIRIPKRDKIYNPTVDGGTDPGEKESNRDIFGEYPSIVIAKLIKGILILNKNNKYIKIYRSENSRYEDRLRSFYEELQDIAIKSWANADKDVYDLTFNTDQADNLEGFQNKKEYILNNTLEAFICNSKLYKEIISTNYMDDESNDNENVSLNNVWLNKEKEKIPVVRGDQPFGSRETIKHV